MGNPSKTGAEARIHERLDAVEAQLSRVAGDVDVLKADQRQLRAAVTGADVDVVANPKRKRAKLTSAERRAIRKQTAARARAAKPVGKGRGAISAQKKRELQQKK